jgi:hypothetical protein
LTIRLNAQRFFQQQCHSIIATRSSDKSGDSISLKQTEMNGRSHHDALISLSKFRAVQQAGAAPRSL